MRIISGSAKSIRLKTIKGSNIRPTTDRVKESLFNIIQNDIEDALVLDLFAGSGALGIEALSRGARLSIFIDNDKEAIDIIKKNLLLAKLEIKAKVYRNDVENAIKKLSDRKFKFNLILMDPPYDKNYIIPTLKKLINNDIINNNAIIVIEHSVREIINEKEINGLVIYKKQKYGEIMITFLRK